MNKPQGEAEIVYLKDLEEDYYRLNFLVDQKDENIRKAIEVSIQAGEIVGILYDALLNQYIDKEDEKTLKDLNILCVRLVFCFYAEDGGLFGKQKMFHDYMYKFKESLAIKTFNTRKRRLENLQEKIASLKFLDPAAGSRIIIMTTADSNDGFWVLSPLLEKQNMK